MKTFLLFCATLTMAAVNDVHASDHHEGDILTVTAAHGLRMRMAPNQQAKTIRILDRGQEVVVTNTFGYPDSHSGRIEWMDGHWIKVRVGEVSGYVFDGFLSRFPAPTHEAQLCIDCDNIVHSIDRYLFDNYHPVSMDDGPDHSEDITQFITCLQDSICTTKTSGDGWYQFEADFNGKRISEVIGLMRSLIVGNDMLDAFNESLVFYEDKHGHVRKVEVRLFLSPISIETTSEGVHLSSMLLGVVDGC